MPEVMAGLRLALTMDEAAAALGCSRRSMYRLVAHGEIEAVKVGSLTRVPITVLENYLTSKLTPPLPLTPSPAPQAPAQWRGGGGGAGVKRDPRGGGPFSPRRRAWGGRRRAPRAPRGGRR